MSDDPTPDARRGPVPRHALTAGLAAPALPPRTAGAHRRARRRPRLSALAQIVWGGPR